MVSFSLVVNLCAKKMGRKRREGVGGLAIYGVAFAPFGCESFRNVNPTIELIAHISTICTQLSGYPHTYTQRPALSHHYRERQTQTYSLREREGKRPHRLPTSSAQPSLV